MSETYEIGVIIFIVLLKLHYLKQCIFYTAVLVIFTIEKFPEGWQKSHPRQSQIVQVKALENEEAVQVPDAWSKLRKQSWARLLQKVYEVDPFICPKCQGIMSVVAIIEDPKELTNIINWAKHQVWEQTVTLCARSPPELALASV